MQLEGTLNENNYRKESYNKLQEKNDELVCDLKENKLQYENDVNKIKSEYCSKIDEMDKIHDKKTNEITMQMSDKKKIIGELELRICDIEKKYILINKDLESQFNEYKSR